MSATPPIRVLWLVKGLGPGGAERLLVTAAEHRDRSGFLVETVYLLSWKPQLVPELEALGVPCRSLGVRRLADLRWLIRLRRELPRADVVHVHSPILAVATRMLRGTLSRGRRPALLVTEHNRWQSHSRLTRTANALTWGLDDDHLVVSRDVAASLWPRRRRAVDVVVHGPSRPTSSNGAASRDEVRSSLGASRSDLLAVCVANLRSTKDHATLLTAVERLPAASPLRVALVGQGPLEGDLRADVEARQLSRVTVAGHRADIPAVLDAADLFVLPSRHEGLPIALLEALAAGLPVICTAVGGIPEVVNDGREGRLVPPGDPDRLAAALVELSADPDLRTRMGAAARVRAAAFDPATAVADAERRYRRLAVPPTTHHR